MRGTPGTETSKYREEEKSTEIPRVVASESGRGQTSERRKSNCVGKQTEEGESPVDEKAASGRYPEYQRARGTR